MEVGAEIVKLKMMETMSCQAVKGGIEKGSIGAGRRRPATIALLLTAWFDN
jgi:hypothetical protein